MKQLITTLFLFFWGISLPAQITVSNGAKNAIAYPNFNDIDYVVMFNGFDSNAIIEYTGSGANFEWKYYDGNSIATTSYIYPDTDATGYCLYVDGSATPTLTIWVIDYNNYLPVAGVNDLTIVSETEDEFENTTLKLVPATTPLTYRPFQGSPRSIAREHEITYQTEEWQTDSWEQTSTTATVDASENEWKVPAPYCNTNFTLTLHDTYMSILGIEPISITSESYTAIAFSYKLTSITTTRDATNEAERPDTSSVVNGSGPLDIAFNANPTSVANHIIWNISKDGENLLTWNQEQINYSFNSSGIYNVKATISNTNTGKTLTDSLTIQIRESALQVPNVFTPNDDGVNDEFRVAYRSLNSFNIWIYNRWGRLVYRSDNPQRGWDGRIGGKQAAAGAYFYVINAVGTDGIKYERKGDINLLR